MCGESIAIPDGGGTEKCQYYGPSLTVRDVLATLQAAPWFCETGALD